MVQIIPAILALDEDSFERDLRRIEESGDFEWVHVDFCDGKFVETKTVTPEVLKKFPTKLKVEAHLMVENPKEWVKDLEVERVVIHKEAVSGQLPETSKQLGLAFNPETSVGGQVEDLDCILIMGVYPGKQGQEFLPETLGKIKEALRLRSENKFLIGVDGGISSENIRKIVGAGADYVVVGSHLLKGNIDENLQKIKGVAD